MLLIIIAEPAKPSQPLREEICLTNQTICAILPTMVESRVMRLMAAYPIVYQACHREHLRTDEAGRTLTENQLRILDHLTGPRPATLSKLAEHMGVSRSTMSVTVRRLMRAGYLARTPAKDDRRSFALTLTAAGRRIQEQNTVLDPALVEKMIRMLSAEEAERAVAGLERLAGCAARQLKQRKREIDR